MKNIKLLILLLLILPSAMRAQTHKSLRVVFISASNEYVSHITLKAYKKYLEKTYPGIRITILQGNGPVNDKDEYTNLDGTDALPNCDVLLVFARRTGFSGGLGTPRDFQQTSRSWTRATQKTSCSSRARN